MKRILLYSLIIIVIFIIIGLVYVRQISHRCIPDYNSNIKLPELNYEVEVFRDSFAVPHVYAKNEHDLYFITGFLLAEDRLWQMDLLRRITEGRLSEIFGDDYIENDMLLRSLRFHKKSSQILSQIDSTGLLALKAFADGVNKYIELNIKKLPPEFIILRYTPEKWEPYHSLNLIGYMAWDLKSGWSELLLSSIRKKVDSLRYQQLLPDLAGMKSTIFPLDNSGSFSSLLKEMIYNEKKLQDIGSDILEASNNWAVAGEKSKTGKPILANDMHLGLNIPGTWYQMHQIVAGKLNVTGLVLPGAPVIVCGHNDSIAWGMTNTYVDNMDFYEEKLNPEDSTLYEYEGTWKKFDIETVLIKTGQNSGVERKIIYSLRGPVISGFKKISGKTVSMHWVGDEESDELTSILNLNSAKNWYDFTNALKTFKSISQNIAYADVKGNIGLYCAAGVPIRKRDINIGILPGNTNEYDWKGFVPFEDLPHIYNPKTGYVASANNKTAPPDYPYHIGTWYSLPYRYDRITELLLSKDILSVEDLKGIQNDQYSKLAEKYLPLMLAAINEQKDPDNTKKRSLEILRKWNYQMNVKEPAALIFESMYLEFIKATFSDELGKELFASFNSVTSILRIATDQLINRRESLWFDNINTPSVKENFNDAVISAFSKTVIKLKDTLGDNPETWEWGKVHVLTLSHPLSKVKILEKVFDLNPDPDPVGGSFHTVSPYSYDNNSPFNVNHGASHRHIYDLNDWDNSLTVIPTGISGIPASKHYSDQKELYIKGKYHHDYFSMRKIIASSKYHMTFKP